MPRFKPVRKGLKLLPVDFELQLIPGTFEHALSYLIDHKLNLSDLEARYCNDKQGASAYAPAVLLKSDFAFDAENKACTCTAGNQLYGNGPNCVFNGYLAIKFQGAQQDCLPCDLRSQCLRTPDKTKTRQVSFFLGRAPGHETHTDRMKVKIDSDRGKGMITRRFATVEPAFGIRSFTSFSSLKVGVPLWGNVRNNKRLDRFTLRGRDKVDRQWKLYCLVHNIEKLAYHGYAN